MAKIYRVQGKFIMRDSWQNFKKEILATKEKDALEKIYSLLGSKHKVKRNKIIINEITEIQPKNAEDSLTRKLAGVE